MQFYSVCLFVCLSSGSTSGGEDSEPEVRPRVWPSFRPLRFPQREGMLLFCFVLFFNFPVKSGEGAMRRSKSARHFFFLRCAFVRWGFCRSFALILRCSQSTWIVAAAPLFDLAAAKSLIRPSPFGRRSRRFLCTFGGCMGLGRASDTPADRNGTVPSCHFLAAFPLVDNHKL